QARRALPTTKTCLIVRLVLSSCPAGFGGRIHHKARLGVRARRVGRIVRKCQVSSTPSHLWPFPTTSNELQNLHDLRRRTRECRDEMPGRLVRSSRDCRRVVI